MSTALLGLLGAVVLFFVLSTAQPTREMSQREIAAQFAASELERARAEKPASLTSEGLPSFTGPDGTVFNAYQQVSPVADSEALEHVRIVVTWKSRSRSLQTEQQGYVGAFAY